MVTELFIFVLFTPRTLAYTDVDMCSNTTNRHILLRAVENGEMHCFWSVPNGTPYECEQLCQTNNGTLAIFPSEAMLDKVANVVASELDFQPFWIGKKTMQPSYDMFKPAGFVENPEKDCIFITISPDVTPNERYCDTTSAQIGICSISTPTPENEPTKTLPISETSFTKETLVLTTETPGATESETAELTETSSVVTADTSTRVTFEATVVSSAKTIEFSTKTQNIAETLQTTVAPSTSVSEGNPISSCSCHCTISNATHDFTSQKMKEEGKIYRKKLSSAIRKKTSAEDPRASAKSIGYVGVFLLTSVAVLILLADSLTFFQIGLPKQR